MKKNIKYILPFIFFLFLFAIPKASAATEDLGPYLIGIYIALSGITVAAATLAFMLAAIQYMTGTKDSINKAKKYVESGVIALIVVASAYLFFTMLSPDVFGG